METSESMTYVGRNPCGCVVFEAIDLPHVRNEIAKEMRYCVKRGYPVNRITSDESRSQPFYCEEHGPKKKGKQTCAHCRT